MGKTLMGKTLIRSITILLVIGILSACSHKPQLHSSLQHRNTGLEAGQLEEYGLAFVTPSTVTGQEEDKQTLALIFSQTLINTMPQVRCVTLPETLSAVNRNDLTMEYKEMYQNYSKTGIFAKESLQKVGEVAGARYVVQLNLADFGRRTDKRWGFSGIRVLATKTTHIRLFMQIWDSQEGDIVWEGGHELSYAYDTVKEKPVTFQKVVEEAAENLLNNLPKVPQEKIGAK
jgi:hypothetical protein